MNNRDITYVFSGFGCEYSLAPLAKHMQDKGLKVIELDMLQVSKAMEILGSIKGEKTIHITSWHLFFDAKNFGCYCKTENEIYSPLEIMDYLKPIKSFYYPHDVEMFLHQEEWQWLDLFDAVLLPYINNDYFFIQQYTKVYEVGWIKKIKELHKRQIDFKDLKILYMPSNNVYHMNKYSLEEYKELYSELLKRCDGVKFPQWTGIEQLQEIVKDNGGQVIDSDKTLFDVIEDYDLVITTGASGVIGEASGSGWPVITILDGALPDEEYKAMISDYEWIYPLPLLEAVAFIDDIKQGRKRLDKGNNTMQVFDINQVMKIITDY